MKKIVLQAEKVQEDGPFVGEIEIEMPNHRERTKMIKEMGYQFNEKGELDTSKKSAIEFSDELFSIIEKRVKKVTLTHAETEDEFNSLDDLGIYEEGAQFINELAGVLMRGPRLGNGSKAS